MAGTVHEITGNKVKLLAHGNTFELNIDNFYKPVLGTEIFIELKIFEMKKEK